MNLHLHSLPNSYRLRTTIHRVILLALLLVPLLLFWFPILGDRTVSFNPLSGMPNATPLPLQDPAAGSFQDEPWLRYIGMHWRDGNFPLINQDNGLGAPFFASLQSGALYPLNIVITLFPLDSPQFFDLFAFIHVVLLVCGTMLLARRYSTSALTAVLIAFFLGTSLTVVYNVNMVHFRVFTWMPWLAVVIIDLLRGRPAGLRSLALAALMWCLFSAGNPQEAVMDLLAIFILAAAEVIRTPIPKQLILRVACIVAATLLFCTPLIYVYLDEVRRGILFTISNPARSQGAIGWHWMLDLLIPRGGGFAGNWFRSSPQVDMQPAITVPWLCGMALIANSLIHRKLNQRQTIWVLLLMAVLFVGMAKICGLGSWSWLQAIPVVNGIRFTKYTTYLIVIMLPLAARGLDLLVRESNSSLQQVNRMKQAAVASMAVSSLVIIALGALVFDKSWIPTHQSPGLNWFIVGAVMTLVLAIMLPWILVHRRRLLLLFPLLCVYSLIMRGNAWPIETHYPQSPTPATAALQPANYSDENWDHGVHRVLPGFFVKNRELLKPLQPGDKLTGADQRSRVIQRITGDQIWLNGPPLDPLKDGYPHVFHIGSEAVARLALASPPPSHYPRTATLETPNTNLIRGLASLWVFNPVLNDRYHKWMSREFDMVNPGFWMQPKPGHPFSQRQTNLLWFLGVGLIRGYAIEATPRYKMLGRDLYVANGTVFPECIAVPERIIPALESQFSSGNYGTLGEMALSAGQVCDIRRHGPNSIEVSIAKGTGERRVMISRIYDPGWRGSKVVAFANTLLSIDIGSSASDVALTYRPVGWYHAWWASLFGALALVALSVLSSIGILRRYLSVRSEALEARGAQSG